MVIANARIASIQAMDILLYYLIQIYRGCISDDDQISALIQDIYFNPGHYRQVCPILWFIFFAMLFIQGKGSLLYPRMGIYT